MKRPLLIIAICLLLGAVLNVAVVLACVSLWGHPSGIYQLTTTSARPFPEAWPAPRETNVDSIGGTTIVINVAPGPGGPQWQYEQILLRWGWPLRNLEWDVRTVRNLEAGSVPPIVYRAFRGLWPAFAVNTFFYAPPLWLFICAAFVLRRFLRVRRGLCSKCAYPMGESAVCSECGKPLPSRTRSNHRQHRRSALLE